MKRAFAKFDLLAESDWPGRDGSDREPPLARLRALSPAGKEEAWQSLVDGLEGLVKASGSSMKHEA